MKIKFALRSRIENKLHPIQAFITLGRNNQFYIKTGKTCKVNNWSFETKKSNFGKLKQTITENKKINTNLSLLETTLEDNYKLALEKGSTINKAWFEKEIHSFFNRSTDKDVNVLTNRIEYIIENASTWKVKTKDGYKTGLKDNSVKNYRTFLNTILEYEAHKNIKIKFMDINFSFGEDFTNWLLITKRYGPETAGKRIIQLKSICNGAILDSSIKLNPEYKNIQGFTKANEERIIITLTTKELEQIKNAKIKTPYLTNARKWLLIGCEIGQRASDLLKITKHNFRYLEGNFVIDLKQEKTGKDVTLPVLDNDVVNILTNEMPHPISSVNLNIYIKEVCKKAGINEIIEGKKFCNKIKRKVKGKFPKHELITAHTFRRSLATNYYKTISTTVLMTMTGHSSEATFLKYINKQKDNDSNALEFINTIKNKQTPILKIVKEESA